MSKHRVQKRKSWPGYFNSGSQFLVLPLFSTLMIDRQHSAHRGCKNVCGHQRIKLFFCTCLELESFEPRSFADIKRCFHIGDG